MRDGVVTLNVLKLAAKVYRRTTEDMDYAELNLNVMLGVLAPRPCLQTLVVSDRLLLCSTRCVFRRCMHMWAGSWWCWMTKMLSIMTCSSALMGYAPTIVRIVWHVLTH